MRFDAVRRVMPVRSGLLLIVAVAASCGAQVRANPPSNVSLAKYELADLRALESAFVELAESVRPSVVVIRCYRTQVVDGSSSPVKIPAGQGSGFVIGANGFIATNRHVVEGADSVTVTMFNGETLDGQVLQKDVRSDLAVLQVPASELPVVRFGDLSSVRVNQWTFACGNPFGRANHDGKASVSFGVVSGLGREITDEIPGDPNVQYYGNLIETTAGVSPGSSGGPLFNIQGEVIGVVTAIKLPTAMNSGSGFAIPIERGTVTLLETLKTGRIFEYGYLGLTVEDMEPPVSQRVSQAASSRGAKIVRVDPPDGPGGRAGLRADDVVVEFDGVPIKSKDHLVRLVGFTPVGTRSEVVYVRHGVRRTTSVTVGDRAKIQGWAQK